jgi:hypothetical protein
MQTRSRSKGIELPSDQQPVPTKSSRTLNKKKKINNDTPSKVLDDTPIKWVDFYDPQDNLTKYTQKILPFMNSKEFDGTTVAEKKKQAKDIFYSIDLVSIMRKPDKLAKLYNHYDVSTPNEEHQCDLLVLPNDSGFRYVFVVIDVASRYRECKPLRFKTTNACADVLKAIYDDKNCPLKPPLYMRTDQGPEFRGAFTQYLSSVNVVHLY